MADVLFKEGTLSRYNAITPDDHTFYNITDDDKVYLGTKLLTDEGVAEQLGTSTIGGVATPIYLSSGIATPLTSTVGSTTQPAFMSAGTITAMTGTVGTVSKPVFMSAGAITALTSTVGSVSKPVFMSSGAITALTSTVGSASVPVYMSSGAITACTSVATSSISVSGTLTSSAWSGSAAPYSQTLTVSGLGSSQNGIFGLAQGVTQAQMEAAAAAMIGISSQSSGSLVVAAFGEKPTVDIPVTVTLLG